MNRRGFLGTLLGAAMATMAKPLLASTPTVVKPEQVSESSREGSWNDSGVIVWGDVNAASQRMGHVDIDRACDQIPGLKMWNMITQRWEPWR